MFGVVVIGVLYWFAAAVSVPLLLLRGLGNPSWRTSLRERLGRGRWEKLPGDLEGAYWFHGASVGEVGGLAPILRRLRADDPTLKIVLTTTSLTGKARALQDGLADFVSLLPFDHPRIIRRVLNSVSPSVFIIAETEIWPNLLLALKRKNIPVIVVNGRISAYSYPRYKKLRFLLKPVFAAISRVLAQSLTDAQRFISLGVSSDRVKVVGSTKYDQPVPRYSANDLSNIATEFGLEMRRPIFVAGSVRAGEEGIIIELLHGLRKRCPALQTIIAPRHPERFVAFAESLSKRGFHFNKRSEGRAVGKRPIFLLDTLGELQKAYAICNFAFVGGSLENAGGHNPLEPAAYKKAVIVGPHTSNVHDVVVALKEVGALVEVNSGQELSSVVSSMVADLDKTAELGKSAFKVWERNIGATERVSDEIKDILGVSYRLRKAVYTCRK